MEILLRIHETYINYMYLYTVLPLEVFEKSHMPKKCF
jgi:hypothetical protein